VGGRRQGKRDVRRMISVSRADRYVRGWGTCKESWAVFREEICVKKKELWFE